LDCVFYEPTLTYYVLDLMCWKGNYYFDCEADFRFFWLYNKFSETDNLDKVTTNNPYKFVPMPRYPCTKENILTMNEKTLPLNRRILLLSQRRSLLQRRNPFSLLFIQRRFQQSPYPSQQTTHRKLRKTVTQILQNIQFYYYLPTNKIIIKAHCIQNFSSTKTIKSSSLSFQSINHIHRSDCLSSCMFTISNSITNYIFQE